MTYKEIFKMVDDVIEPYLYTQGEHIDLLKYVLECTTNIYIEDRKLYQKNINSERTNAKWKTTLEGFTCSYCSHEFEHRHNYCPCCGSEMVN